jgi:hypothetical protein
MTIRPEYHVASMKLRLLAISLHAGEITMDEWATEVKDVLAPLGYGLSSSPDDPSSGAALAVPSPSDPEETVAPKLSARLLESHGADCDRVQRHAA